MIFAEYQRLNGQEQKCLFPNVLEWTRTKMTIFDVIVSFFLLKSSLQTQKSTFTAKFSPISSLEVIFFALILCWGRATASHSGEY